MLQSMHFEHLSNHHKLNLISCCNASGFFKIKAKDHRKDERGGNITWKKTEKPAQSSEMEICSDGLSFERQEGQTEIENKRKIKRCAAKKKEGEKLIDSNYLLQTEVLFIILFLIQRI